MIREIFENRMVPMTLAGIERGLALAAAREAGGDDRTIYRSRVGTGGASLDPVLRTILRRQNRDLLRTLGYEA